MLNCKHHSLIVFIKTGPISRGDAGKEQEYLTLKAPCKICIRQHFDFFLFITIYFSEKISFDISCESSAWLMIHMKCQYCSLKTNKIKIVYYYSCDWCFKG